MKVLVTGANGLLGANLIRELINYGVAVKAFVRPDANLKSLHGVPCQIHRGSILSYDDIHVALEDCDAVIHAASTTSVRPVEFEFYEKTNVESTKNIVQAVMRQGSKRLVYVSTANVFGPGPMTNPGTERSSFTLGKFNSGYINSKHMAQHYVLHHTKTHNLNAVVVNPTFLIGPYDTKPSSGKIILFGLKHGKYWCPPGGKNFVHVRDVARGIYSALMDGRTGECYLLGGENLSYQDFFYLLSLTSGQKRKPFVVPKGVILAAGTVAQAWAALTDQTLSFNKTNAQLLTLDNYYSGEKAKTEFKLQVTPIKLAIKEALDWFVKENYIGPDYSTQGTTFDS